MVAGLKPDHLNNSVWSLSDVVHDVLKGGHDVSDEPRDEGGKWTSGGDGDSSQGFVSPNVGNLNFTEAMAGLSSARQKALMGASVAVDKAIGRDPATPRDVIGAWADGAENSMALQMPGWSTQEARVALAMKGWLADQKSVLSFTPAKDGNAYMATFNAAGDLAQIHQQLLDSGLAFHTLEPISDGAIVHVYGDDQDTADKIGKAATSYGGKTQFTFGNGEFIGTSKNDGTDREQRDDARKQYETVIREAAASPEFRGRNLAESWNDLRDHWGGILSQTKTVAGRESHYRDAGKQQGSSSDGAGDHAGARSGEGSRQSLKGGGGHDVSDEPRDEGGKWTSGGGGGDGDDDEHPGKGYSKDAYVDARGVIHTNNVYDAQRALFENRKVELTQVKQVSTLIKQLGKTAAEMAEHGETAPVFNLCNVSVKGTNLFCADQIGIPRVEMPVIRAGATKDFIKYLRKQGYDIEKGNERAANLRATQNEISGVKVAAAVQKIKDRGFYKRLVISKDDYILDGHHTWAGQLAIDAKSGTLKADKSVKIARVNISITKLLAEAEKWTGGAGKKPASEAPKNYRQITLRQARVELVPATYRKFAEVAYQFLDANRHLELAFDDILITVKIDD